MIGRADIEESKSNVAMNAWLPQASYPFSKKRYKVGDTNVRFDISKLHRTKPNSNATA